MRTIRVDQPVKLQGTPDWRPPPEGRWIVVWYRQVLPRVGANHEQPLLNIAFRNLNALTASGNAPGEFVRVDRPVTELGQLRLGTIVCDGRVTERVQLESTQDFSVVFPEGGGPLRELTRLQIPTAVLPPWFAGVSLGGHALAFPLSGGGCLWIPCLEFLSRFYGRSQEIKRILLMYPWSWARPRLISSEASGPVPASSSHVWRVRFGWYARRLVSGDAVFLAHLRHSPWTQRCARRLYRQMEQAHPAAASPQSTGVYLKVDPWFSGPAQLRVSGFPLPDGGFLALRLDGGSDPPGPRIVRERDRRAPARVRRADRGNQGRRSPSRRSPEALEREQPPDRRSFHIPLPDPPFEVLGVPQLVNEVTAESSDLGARSSLLPPGDVDAVSSTAEPSGSGKGIESAIIHAPPHGALRDVWNALCRLRELYPEQIFSVHWYYPSQGFVFSDSPRLVPLMSVPPPGEPGFGWLSVDRGTEGGGVGVRALLVVRIVIRGDSSSGGGRTLYLVEIERRLTSRGEEENLRGVIFEFEPNGDPAPQFARWLNELRADLVLTGASFLTQLCAACLGRAVPLIYSPAQSGVSGEHVLRRALRTMGVVLPE